MPGTLAHSGGPNREAVDWPADQVQSGLDSGEAQSQALARPLARGLGWFSIGIGLSQLLAPVRVTSLVGAPPTSTSHAVMRLMGARELIHGMGILTSDRPAPWVWSRVAGDALDLGLLARAYTHPESDKGRVAAAMAAVGGTTVADLIDSTQLDSDAESVRAPAPMRVKAAVTIRRSADDLYRYWRDFENLPDVMTHLDSVVDLGDGVSEWSTRAPFARSFSWQAEMLEDEPGRLVSWQSLPGSSIENSGEVRFVTAPRDQGTEVHVLLRYKAPAGPIGAALAKLFGDDPVQAVKDDLRRFKQAMETGQVVRSDGARTGMDARLQPKQHPARPAAG